MYLSLSSLSMVLCFVWLVCLPCHARRLYYFIDSAFWNVFSVPSRDDESPVFFLLTCGCPCWFNCLCDLRLVLPLIICFILHGWSWVMYYHIIICIIYHIFYCWWIFWLLFLLFFVFVFKIISPISSNLLDCIFYCTNTVEYLCTSGPVGPLR